MSSKSLAEHATTFELSLNMLIDLNKVQGPFPCVWPCGALGGEFVGGSPAENVQFSDLVFCLIFYHYTTRHFGMESYTQKIKCFVFESFFNSFVGVLV